MIFVILWVNVKLCQTGRKKHYHQLDGGQNFPEGRRFAGGRTREVHDTVVTI